MKRFQWREAETAEEATNSTPTTVADLMVTGSRSNQRGSTRAPHATVIKAGGIDLLDLLKDNLIAPSELVNIRSISSLNQISYAKRQGLILGPLVTLAAIAEHKLIQKQYTALAEACSHIATPNIRNAATLGGNLLQRPRCWYFRSNDFHCLRKGGPECFAIPGDNKYHAIFDNEHCAIVHPSTAAIALVALGATIELTSAKGRREMPLENFFIGPNQDIERENTLAAGELITAIKIPDVETRSAHVKLGEKDSFDWSVGDCAVSLLMANGLCKKASIVLGAAAPTPWRAKKAEAFLVGKPITMDTAKEAATLALHGAKPLAHNAYKIPILQAATRRALLQAGSVS